MLRFIEKNSGSLFLYKRLPEEDIVKEHRWISYDEDTDIYI